MSYLRANYHTHTTRCRHAYGTEREFIEEAIRLGIKKLGFSDHVPCPFKNGFESGIRMTMDEAPGYVATIRQLQEEYKDKIRLYVGFEAEYVREFYDEQMKLFNELGCDYLIMGQHFLKSEELGPYTGTQTEDEARIREYVDIVIEGMQTGSFKYIAHPDIINYQGLDSVYDWEMTRLCKAALEMDIPLEINMLGIGENKVYPREKFWQIVSAVGNKVIIGIDAHCVEHMQDIESFEKALDMVEKYNLNLVDDIGL